MEEAVDSNSDGENDSKCDETKDDDEVESERDTKGKLYSDRIQQMVHYINILDERYNFNGSGVTERTIDKGVGDNFYKSIVNDTETFLKVMIVHKCRALR